MDLFQEHPEIYDLMISWENRLNREIPVLDKLFKKYQSHSILDIACGSGWHCIELSKLKYQTSGLDINPAMIQLAKNNARKEKVYCQFKIGDFQYSHKYISKPVDAIISLGNSIAMLSGKTALQRLSRNIYPILNRHGIILFQLVNFNRFQLLEHPAMPIRWIKNNQAEYIFLRHFDLSGKKPILHFIFLYRKNHDWKQKIYSTELFQFDRIMITEILKKTGFRKIRFFGNMNLKAYNAKKSTDLIVLAEK